MSRDTMALDLAYAPECFRGAQIGYHGLVRGDRGMDRVVRGVSERGESWRWRGRALRVAGQGL